MLSILISWCFLSRFLWHHQFDTCHQRYPERSLLFQKHSEAMQFLHRSLSTVRDILCHLQVTQSRQRSQWSGRCSALVCLLDGGACGGGESLVRSGFRGLDRWVYITKVRWFPEGMAHVFLEKHVKIDWTLSTYFEWWFLSWSGYIIRSPFNQPVEWKHGTLSPTCHFSIEPSAWLNGQQPQAASLAQALAACNERMKEQRVGFLGRYVESCGLLNLHSYAKLTLPKTNMDTQNDGLEKVTPLKHGKIWYLC